MLIMLSSQAGGSGWALHPAPQAFSHHSPMCGFSANAAGILQSYGGEFFHVDVIADPEVRQGVKEYSNWPTLPQVYVGGEFLGGSDILMQMHQAGELSEVIEKARSEA